MDGQLWDGFATGEGLKGAESIPLESQLGWEPMPANSPLRLALVWPLAAKHRLAAIHLPASDGVQERIRLVYRTQAPGQCAVPSPKHPARTVVANGCTLLAKQVRLLVESPGEAGSLVRIPIPMKPLDWVRLEATNLRLNCNQMGASCQQREPVAVSSWHADIPTAVLGASPASRMLVVDSIELVPLDSGPTELEVPLWSYEADSSRRRASALQAHKISASTTVLDQGVQHSVRSHSGSLGWDFTACVREPS